MHGLRNFKTTLSVIVLILVMNVVSIGQQALYLDFSKPIEKRVEDLLPRMTLEEKIGQLNMPTVYCRELGKDIASKPRTWLRFPPCRRTRSPPRGRPVRSPARRSRRFRTASPHKDGSPNRYSRNRSPADRFRPASGHPGRPLR